MKGNSLAAYPTATLRTRARLLQVSQKTVRQWLRQGKVRGYSLGATKLGYRIPAEEAQRVLREGPAPYHAGD